MMETASTCTEGRAAICGEEGCVGAVLGRVLKGSAAATEHATVVLWSVCCLFWDKRARDAVAKGGNGSTKMLLLMQGSFSPAVREMAGDLLKIFRVSNPKCGITGLRLHLETQIEK
ncbi:U-box domain-containing protein 28 [Acorus calamus]|uniref:U-box domain-containing protein n=1 Tax=Acorus calamus TaxID=4465 RepID=A0AAV9ECH9_ACOCL|nr:U-box domain-containing protein 28 [Acorus calamus]